MSAFIDSLRAPENKDTVALLLELALGFTGMLGMGWLYAGRIGIAALLFFGYALLLVAEFFAVAVTVGLVALCMAPINVIIWVVSAAAVRAYVRKNDPEVSFRPVAITVLALLVLACALVSGFFLFAAQNS